MPPHVLTRSRPARFGSRRLSRRREAHALGHGRQQRVRIGLRHTTSVTITTWLVLLAAGPIARALGRTGLNIANRFTGPILAAIAVESIASGLLEIFPVWSAGRRAEVRGPEPSRQAECSYGRADHTLSTLSAADPKRPRETNS